ncbi:MAG: hypothetical protein AAF170_15385 [Bacteroidota bacterium]
MIRLAPLVALFLSAAALAQSDAVGMWEYTATQGGQPVTTGVFVIPAEGLKGRFTSNEFQVSSEVTDATVEVNGDLLRYAGTITVQGSELAMVVMGTLSNAGIVGTLSVEGQATLALTAQPAVSTPLRPAEPTPRPVRQPVARPRTGDTP